MFIYFLYLKKTFYSCCWVEVKFIKFPALIWARAVGLLNATCISENFRLTNI